MKEIATGKRGVLFRCLVFTVILVMIFLLVQEILSPQWRYPHFNDGMEDALNEFYSMPDDSIQALFFGSSHVADSVDPMRIYERSGIVTYNLGTAGQTLAISVSLLNEALKTQEPKVVFLDVSGVFNNSTFIDSTYRYALDLLPFGDSKIDLAKIYASNYDEARRLSFFLSAFFPIYSYHDRWTSLKALDFDLFPDRNLYRKGYFLYTPYRTIATDIDGMNSIQDELSQSSGSVVEIKNGAVSSSEIDKPIYVPGFSDENLEYFLQFIQICEENDITLKLVKIPTIYAPQAYHGAWTSLRSSMAKGLAQEYGLPFLDLLYDYDIGIDWTHDTPDGGQHLNYSGAKKVSDFFADQLKNECGLQGTVCEDYERDRPIYDAICQASELQSTRDMLSFLEAASQREHTTIFFSASDDMKNALSEEAVDALHRSGLLTDFGLLNYRGAFVGVVDDGVSVYEAVSDRAISHSGQLGEACKYTLKSAGWLVGSKSSIVINGTEYSMGGRGVNIVVYDNEYGVVLDSASFDTFASGNPDAVRNNPRTAEYLREYEERLMAADADGKLAQRLEVNDGIN